MPWRPLNLFLCLVPLVLGGAAQAQNDIPLTGTIEDATAAPAAGASILLISQERALRTKSAVDGSFAFDHLPAGQYEVEVTAAGFAKQRLSLDLQDNTVRSPLSIVLRVGNQPDPETCGSHASILYGSLSSTNSRLSGPVRNLANGHAMRNAEVTVWMAGNPRTVFRSHSNASGRFTFENLPAGCYDLRIAKAGYSPVEMMHRLKPRENELVIDAALLKHGVLVVCQ